VDCYSFGLGIEGLYRLVHIGGHPSLQLVYVVEELQTEETQTWAQCCFNLIVIVGRSKYANILLLKIIISLVIVHTRQRSPLALSPN